METKDPIDNKTVTQNIDFYKIFKVFMSRWYWILGCVAIAVIIAKINILYTVPYYQAQASIKIQEGNPILNGPSQASSQVASYTDKILAEGYVIRSNDVVLSAIKNLNYKISYHLKGRIRTTEQYPNIPFKVEIIAQDSVNFSREKFEVKHINKEKFGIKSELDEKGSLKEYRYGQPITMGNTTFKITSKIPKNGNYSFNFNSKDDFVGRVASGLNTAEAARFTNVMNITMQDQNSVFAADILNEITHEYIKNDMQVKQASANQTVEFIEKQLRFLNKQVDSSSSDLTNYKIRQGGISDVPSKTSVLVTKQTEAERQKYLLDIEMIVINQLEQQVNDPGNKTELNVGMEGVLSPNQAYLVSAFNALLLTRETKLTDFGSESTPIIELDKQIESRRETIKQNLSALKTNNINKQKFYQEQLAEVSAEIKALPEKEQEFIKLSSKFQVNNKVKEYLEEKKIEANLNAAATVPGASVVNKAFPGVSIGINTTNIYGYAVMMGLAAGCGLIMLVRFLNPYIYDKETVESLTRTPIIGVIRKFPEYIDKNNRQALSLSKPKSVFAESVRSVRTNLSFMASNKKSKTICITSEVSGEGKSFVTVNLAGTLALIDKRVILIAADLRKSKLHKAFGSNNKVGLSSYLSGQAELGDVIVHDEVHNIDFMPSGPVPPNPSELLHTEKMKELLAILAPKYDYVLVDTAPVGLVSDAIPLIRQSDVNLFVIRVLENHNYALLQSQNAFQESMD